MHSPGQIVDDESGEPEQKVFQSIITFAGKGDYLVRVFVNMDKQPPVVKSVYKTSKINKYYESKI